MRTSGIRGFAAGVRRFTLRCVRGQAHAWHRGLTFSKRILSSPHPVSIRRLADGGPPCAVRPSGVTPAVSAAHLATRQHDFTQYLIDRNRRVRAYLTLVEAQAAVQILAQRILFNWRLRVHSEDAEAWLVAQNYRVWRLRASVPLPNRELADTQFRDNT